MHEEISKKAHAPRSSGWHIVFEVSKFIFLALLIITPFRYFVAQPFIVSGASMEPSINPKEYLVIDQLTYRFEKPQRGDVIIFRYPLDPALYFIKRVIGLPGEHIEYEDGVVSISERGEKPYILVEPYLPEGGVAQESIAVTLDTNEYFVLGDNRSASSDSRKWGPLAERYIIGRPIARLFPFHEVTLLPGVYNFSD